MIIADNLRQIALEIASMCWDDSTGLQVQIGDLRTITGWFCGAQGMDVEAAKETAETLVGLVLDEVLHIRANKGARVQ